MSFVHTTDDPNHEDLRREIDAALEDGILMSRGDVLAIWRLAENLPYIQTRRVFLEIGEQRYNANESLASGRGWSHILAKHAKSFIGKGLEEGEIFSHISEALLVEDVHSATDDNNKPCIFYLEDAASGPYLLAIAMGINGYLVTAYPKPLFRNSCTNSLASKRKRARPGKAETSTDEIEKSDGAALLVSQNIDCILMWKSPQGHLLEYFDATEFVDGPLADAIVNYGSWNREVAMTGWKFDEEIHWHEVEGLRIALQLNTILDEPVFYESVHGRIFKIDEPVAKMLYRSSISLIFSEIKSAQMRNSSSNHGSSSPLKPVAKKRKLLEEEEEVAVADISVIKDSLVIEQGGITLSKYKKRGGKRQGRSV